MTGDALQVAATPLADGPARLARVEAVLFVSREAVSLKRLAQLANLTDATEARTLTSTIDKAVKRGALHRNTGARKKARASRLLVAASGDKAAS